MKQIKRSYKITKILKYWKNVLDKARKRKNNKNNKMNMSFINKNIYLRNKLGKKMNKKE